MNVCRKFLNDGKLFRGSWNRSHVNFALLWCKAVLSFYLKVTIII
jgi:hypothetical protein